MSKGSANHQRRLLRQAGLPREGAQRARRRQARTTPSSTSSTRQATREVIELQEELGLDILVHGEMERGDMVAYFARSSFPRHEARRPRPLLRQPLLPQAGHRRRTRAGTSPMTVEMWKYAQSPDRQAGQGHAHRPLHDGRVVVRRALPDAPRRRPGDGAGRSASEVAGAREGRRAATSRSTSPPSPRAPRDLDLAIEAMGVVTEGPHGQDHHAHLLRRLRAGLRRAGQDAGRPVRPRDGEQRLRPARRHEDAGFRRKEIGLGVLDVHTHEVETVDEVKAGIKRALEVLPPERIYVDPDCGLKTRTWDESEAKLQVMIDAVRRVKAEMGIE